MGDRSVAGGERRSRRTHAERFAPGVADVLTGRRPHDDAGWWRVWVQFGALTSLAAAVQTGNPERIARAFAAVRSAARNGDR